MSAESKGDMDAPTIRSSNGMGEAEAALDEQIATYNAAIEAGDKEAASKAWDEVLRRQYRLIMERRPSPIHVLGESTLEQ